MDNTIITLTLTLAQINVIVGALGKQPLEVGLEVFNIIKSQVEKQTVPAIPMPEEPAKAGNVN